MSYLCVEIYPPHPDRAIDMVQIWRGAHNLVNDLRATPTIQSLDVCFVEDEIAKWTTPDGESQRTMILFKIYEIFGTKSPCDMLSVLACFSRLTIVASARIHVPDSLQKEAKELRQHA